MINEIRYETFPTDVNWSNRSVFLAGPTVRGQRLLNVWIGIGSYGQRSLHKGLLS